MSKIVPQNIIVLYFLFLLTLSNEVMHCSRVTVIFLKKKKKNFDFMDPILQLILNQLDGK